MTMNVCHGQSSPCYATSSTILASYLASILNLLVNLLAHEQTWMMANLSYVLNQESMTQE